MFRYAQDREPLSGYFMGEVIAQALCMGESNACMRRIVAAPTAGACGVLPAVLIPLWTVSYTHLDVYKRQLSDRW